MKFRQPMLALFLSVTFVAPAISAGAGPLIDLLKLRQTKIDKVLKTRTSEMTKDEKAELGKILGEIFDFGAMAERTLGDEWAKRVAPERERFAAEFERLLRATSIRGVDAYRSEGIAYSKESINGKSGNVKTTVRSKSATTDVEYTFLKSKAGWMVVDYTIDGVSAVRNYRVQFAKIIDKHGWDELVKRVHTRAEKLENAVDDGAGKEVDDAKP